MQTILQLISALPLMANSRDHQIQVLVSLVLLFAYLWYHFSDLKNLDIISKYYC